MSGLDSHTQSLNHAHTSAPAALITGASMGLGLGLATLFARDGYRLVLVARSHDRLTAVGDELHSRYGVQVKVLAKDLASSNAAEEIVQALRSEMISVDVLVNNAGFGSNGPFAESDPADQLAMIQVNVTALTHLTRLLLPDMIRRKTGRIMNVASTAAFFPGPMMAVYYASKAYVLSFSQALSEELRGTGVTVTALCPGPTRTGFQARAGTSDSAVGKGMLMMNAESVAAAGYRDLMKGKRVSVPGFLNKLSIITARLTPTSVVMRILRILHGTSE